VEVAKTEHQAEHKLLKIEQGQATGEGLSLGRRNLSQATVFTNVVVNNVSSDSRVRGSQFMLPCAVPMCCAPVLP